MRKVSLIFILLLFSTLLNHVILVFSSEFCYGEKLFRNIEEILKSQNSIELTKGISLKRKSFTTQSEHVFSDAISNCTSFRSLQDFEGRIDNVIDNFVMEFDMRNYIKDALNETETSRRRRHQHHQALPMMMMGIVIFLMFFVPMGFNFLGVIVGKSFLMAKLGLLLASVNGLKRVASSGVHYGLYSVPEQHHPPFGGYYDRFDRPREMTN